MGGKHGVSNTPARWEGPGSSSWFTAQMPLRANPLQGSSEKHASRLLAHPELEGRQAQVTRRDQSVVDGSVRGQGWQWPACHQLVWTDGQGQTC